MGKHSIQLYWNLVEKEGFSSNLYDASQIKGNVIALQLVTGGMKLQPCNPTFTTARNAILRADKAYYDGAYQCLIWKAFAKRGLGINSDEASFTDGFMVPEKCMSPREGRLECGQVGTTEEDCNGQGCTWSPLENGSKEPWCFRPTPPEPREGRLECGQVGTTQAECAANGCTWSPLENGSKEPWCFLRSFPREGRIDCGHVGTTDSECKNNGCIWSPLENGSAEPWCFRYR